MVLSALKRIILILNLFPDFFPIVRIISYFIHKHYWKCQTLSAEDLPKAVKEYTKIHTGPSPLDISSCQLLLHSSVTWQETSQKFAWETGHTVTPGSKRACQILQECEAFPKPFGGGAAGPASDSHAVWTRAVSHLFMFS